MIFSAMPNREITINIFSVSPSIGIWLKLRIQQTWTPCLIARGSFPFMLPFPKLKLNRSHGQNSRKLHSLSGADHPSYPNFPQQFWRFLLRNFPFSFLSAAYVFIFQIIRRRWNNLIQTQCSDCDSTPKNWLQKL